MISASTLLRFARIWRHAEAVSLRALYAGVLHPLGPRKVFGKVIQPINSPSRYPEYSCVLALIRDLLDRQQSLRVFDVGSPKVFSLMLAAQTSCRIFLTDIYEPAVEEAKALAQGLPAATQARLHFGVADIRGGVPLPPGFEGGADLTLSISVIEHVRPEVGGDVVALDSMASHTSKGGAVILSLPVGPRFALEYVDGAIYGNAPDAGGRAFHHRVYDAESVMRLAHSSDKLRLERLMHVAWPQDPVFRALMDPTFPAELRAIMGPLFPVLAARARITEYRADTIPTQLEQGDLILSLRRV